MNDFHKVLNASADTQPQDLQFICDLNIEAAGDEKTIKKFSMVAYTGGLMRIAGFPHPVVVDLEGLSVERQDIPVRLDHNPRQGVGHTQSVVIDNGQVTAEGLISRDTSWARDVSKSASNGFPWQASIGAAVIDAQFIPNGQSVNVNGRTFDGPVHVVREAILKEISFVDNGADTNTSAKIAANGKESFEMENDKNKDVEKVETVEKVEKPEKVETQEIPKVTEEPVTEKPVTLEASADDSISDYRMKLAAETRRVEAIRNICDGKYPDIEAKAIEEGWDSTKCELQVLRASRPAAPAVHSKPRNTSPQVFEAAALMASGVNGTFMTSSFDEPVLEAADKLRGIGIQEFCEIASGQQLPRFRRDATGWLQAAFSSASLPGILSNIANKMLLEGYNYVEDQWRTICKIASVNDFKAHTRYRMTSNFTFQPVGPDGEIKHGKIEEQQFSQKADTHGIMFALTRQMIINDDLGAFTDIPRQIGIGAAEAIAEAVWKLLLSNPSSFFSTDNKNYLTGADTVLSVDGLTKAEAKFLEQVKPNGKPLGVVPKILLVPSALKVAAELLMSSLKLNETTTTDKGKPQDNPHAGKYEVATSSYLSNSTFSGYSSKAWYLFADPNRLPSLEVAFLNGVDRPTVEKTDADFNTLGIQFRGYIDFGVKEQDHRGALKLKGEA